MDKQKLVRLSEYNSIPFSEARQKLVDFVMLDTNSLFTVEKLTELLPAIYSYCNHQFKGKGTHLPKVRYNTVSIGENSTIAFVSYNEININTDEFDTEITTLTAEQKLEILDVLFHEHSHLADYNFDAIKTTHNVKTELKQPLQDQCFDYFEDNIKEYVSSDFQDIGKNSNKQKNLFKNFIDLNYKNYFLSAEEARARNTAIKFTREILDEATKQHINSSKQFMLTDLNQAYQDIINDERHEDSHVRSFKLKPELKEILLSMREDMLGELSILSKEFKEEHENNPESSRTQILASNIENLTDPLLVTLYGELYDEKIANEVLNTYIDIAKDNEYFTLGNISGLIGGTKLMPSKEQMLDIAKLFQNKPDVSTFTYNPLDSFITAFHFHDTDELLEIFMIDNPNFGGQLEFYTGFLVDIDEQTKMKHQNAFDKLQKKNKPKLRDKVKGGFEDLFNSMKKEENEEKTKGGFEDLFSSIKKGKATAENISDNTNNNPFSIEIKIDDTLSDEDTFGLE